MVKCSLPLCVLRVSGKLTSAREQIVSAGELRGNANGSKRLYNGRCKIFKINVGCIIPCGYKAEINSAGLRPIF